MTDGDFFHSISLIDSSELTPLPDSISSSAGTVVEQVQFQEFYIASDGNVYASNEDRIAVYDGLAWSDAYAKTTSGDALDIIEVGNILYFLSLIHI